jgi:hypothetical protein
MTRPDACVGGTPAVSCRRPISLLAAMAVPTPSDRRRRTTALRLEGLEPRLAMATFGSDHSLVRLAAPPSALAPTAVHTALLPAITVGAPLALGKPRSDWGMPKIFGSNANFGNYRVTRLIDQRAPFLATGSPRLILAGANTFRSDHAQVARQLARLAVPHVVVTGPRYGHAWGTGWLPAAVQQALA